jgi:tetratricopeptide (TPR) repeat protein
VSSDSEAVKRAIDRSCAQWAGGDIDGALASSREAVAMDPRSAAALTNIGTIMWLKGNVEEAEALYRSAHEIEPAQAGVMLNIAALRNDAGDLEDSLRWVEKAEALVPDNAEVVWRKALIELAMGDYVNGWKHYEAGQGHEAIRGRGPGFQTAPWDGTPCDRLLIWHEQGLGDTVQFVRYAKLCKEKASRVCVLCPKELIALIRTCPFVDDAVDTVARGDFDRQISIMSLPHLFGTTLETVPAPIPYLFADEVAAAAWARRIQSDKLKVGLVWAGHFRKDQLRFNIIDRNRSLSLQQMQPWLELDNVRFYSLQKGEAGLEARGRKIIDIMDEGHDFAETAAIIANLDLVISVGGARRRRDGEAGVGVVAPRCMLALVAQSARESLVSWCASIRPDPSRRLGRCDRDGEERACDVVALSDEGRLSELAPGQYLRLGNPRHEHFSSLGQRPGGPTVDGPPDHARKSRLVRSPQDRSRVPRDRLFESISCRAAHGG